ncbi:MAG: hypothetical protein J5601_00540, partial [Elusimicrobiaceae bacterium]|nr:hypothetical protein [Elusimicrobiaceae bacterium]
YITRLTGKYKGAGFTRRGTGAIACTERISRGIIFDLNAGDYCEKIMKGTQFTSSGVTTFRVYELP